MLAPKPQLGELLMENGAVTPDQLRIGLTEQKKTGQSLGRCLVALGFVQEKIVTAALGGLLGQEPVHLEKVVPDPEAVSLLAREAALRYRVLPIRYERECRRLTLATCEPHNLVMLEEVAERVEGNVDVEPVLAGESELEQALERHYGYPLSIDPILHELENQEIERRYVSGDDYRHPVVRLVNALLADAVKQGASDIHLEPEQGYVRLRYRIDGVLRRIRALHKDHWPALVVRIKVLAGMNIAEQRSAQDGRFSLTVAGREVDFRVSALPVVHGESLVLRVLDRHRNVLTLDRLGLDEDTSHRLRRMLERPEGVILVTGPTGSGKTTTLYALLNGLLDEGFNLVTLEDPVEYALAGVRQCSLGDAVQLDFADGVRALLRQDPDVILIGEVRDPETAQMMLRAAMTGHRVLATLHTRTAAGAVSRLEEMGAAPELLADNLIGVISQRLVRRFCPDCRPWENPQAADAPDPSSATPPNASHRTVDCPTCLQSGYSGRLAVMETLYVDTELATLIAAHVPLPRLLQEARSRGFRTMAEVGMKYVRAGATDLAELARCVDLSALEIEGA